MTIQKMNADSPTFTRRDRKREEKRAAIVAAAEEVFGAKGVADASMSEIAELADVAAGTLYLYFPGKEALFFAAFAKRISTLFESTSKHWEADGPLRDRLGEVVRLHLTFVRNNRGFYEFLMSLGHPDHTSPGAFSPLIEMCDAQLAIQTAAFAKAQANGEISAKLAPEFLSRALRSLAFGMVTDAVNRRKTQDLDSVVEPLVQLFWNGIVK